MDGLAFRRARVMEGLPSAAAAADRVLALGGRRADLAVVLGTGLGGLADRLAGAVSLSAEATGWLPISRALGHAGRLVCGRVGRTDVVALQGRVHAYEGYDRAALSRGVELAAALGCRRILLSNASGGLAADMEPGEVVVLTDHVDCALGRIPTEACRPACDSSVPRSGPRQGIRPVRQTVYDAEMVERALGVARRVGGAARRGVYAFVTGPSYETRAEYRWLRRIGADVVGMSTVPEAVAATGLGLRVLGLSVVTNVARPDAPVATDAEDVCRAAAVAGDLVWAILEGVACGS
jgi:purine-nucleoside phosphorylase